MGAFVRARARVGVFVRDGSRDQTQVLTVAVGHRDDLCADGHELSARLLATLPAQVPLEDLSR